MERKNWPKNSAGMICALADQGGSSKNAVCGPNGSMDRSGTITFRE
jgi:hypothetical protein